MLRKENYSNVEKWRTTKRKQKNRYYGKTENAKNGNNPWTKEEIDMVMEHKLTDRELSALLGRSMMAIQKVRSRQKNPKSDSSKT